MNIMLKPGWKAVGLSAVLLPSIAVGVTQTMSVHVNFSEMLETKKISDLNFGILKANTPATYTLTTDGVVKAKGSGEVVGGTPQAGGITISGSTTQNLDIVAGNYIKNNDVTPSNAYCSYDGGAAAPCALTAVTAPGSGKKLLIGLDIDVGKNIMGFFATPTFDISINYN